MKTYIFTNKYNSLVITLTADNYENAILILSENVLDVDDFRLDSELSEDENFINI